MPSSRDTRAMNIVGEGPFLDAPHSEDLNTIINSVRCIVWAADVAGQGDWEKGEDPDGSRLRWMPRVLNEAAAQGLCPLDIKSGSNYFEAWRDSRHRIDDRRMWNTAFTALVTDQPFYEQVFRCFDRNGAEHWFQEHVKITAMGRGLWYCVGTASDITAHWRSAEQVRRVTRQLDQAMHDQLESSAVLDVLLNCVPVGVALLSRDGRMLRVNREFCRLNNMGESTLTGEPVTRWLDPAISSALLHHLERLLASHKATASEEVVVATPEGKRIWQVGLFPIAMAEDQPLAAGVQLQDVTDRREAENVRLAMHTAEAANAAKDRFLAMLSHELRMPLTPVLALASYLETDRRLPADVCEDLSLIRRNVQLEARLIDDLLDVTRIIRGKLLLVRQNCDMNEIVKHAVELCRPQFSQKRLGLEVCLDAPAAGAWVDPARMQQVVINILTNSLKYTPAGGQVHVRTRNVNHGDAPAVVVEVRDDGIGISSDSLERIFHPFEQAAELHDHQRIAGLGLGLAISRGLVEAHGGSIRAASEGQGKGTTLTVTLPLGSGPDVAPAAATPRGKSEGSRILLVEDHADTAKVLRRLLERMEHAVTHVSTVRDAVNALRGGGFDLMLSDLGLPDGSGRDILKQAGVTIPAVALSGFATDDDVRQTSAAGFVEHLTKPVSLSQLQEVLSRHLPSKE